MKKWSKWLLKVARQRRDARQVEFDSERFELQLRGLPPDSPMWAQFMALLEAEIRTEIGALCSFGLDDAETHRLRGRVGMMIDFRDEMELLWTRAHTPQKPDYESKRKKNAIFD